MSDLADLEQKFQFGTSAKFDFDIRNYNTRDMMNILNISGDPSSLNHFNVKEKTNAVIESVKHDETLSGEMKNKFESFLRAMEFFLIYKYNVKADNYVLDKKLIDPKKLIADVKVTSNSQMNLMGGVSSNDNKVSINTYRRRIVKRQLSFDTKFRPNYFRSDPANWKCVLATPLKNVVSMRLISLEFPNVVYDVDNTLGTNEFRITYHPDVTTDFGGVANDNSPEKVLRREQYGIEKLMLSRANPAGGTGYGNAQVGASNDEISGYRVKYRVPSGNYQSNTMVAALNNFITDDNIVFSIDTKTGRTVISTDLSGADLDDDATFDLDFTNTIEPTIPITKNLGWKLGFRQLKYTGSKTYISEAPVDLGGQKVLFFCVDDYRTNVSENVSIVYENSFMNRNILARIPLKQGKFVVVYDDGSDNIRKSREYFGPVTIDKLHFRLLDEYGMDIRQGYSDYSFGLEFDILYEN